MFRTVIFRTSRSILRLAQVAPAAPIRRSAAVKLSFAAQASIRRPASYAARFASSSGPPPSSQSLDRKHAEELAKEKLPASPRDVSSQSSVRPVLEGSGNRGEDPAAGLKHDIGIVRTTLSLESVPRESRILGLAGTIPYLVTSITTVYLGWHPTKQLATGGPLHHAIFANHDTASSLLHFIEPLQLGYGAVIISFLGAIHWGLEYAEKQPLRERTRFRYGMGLAASIAAWPTLLMPVEYALISQFTAFVALYFADARATVRGWAPSWYANYRFMLTAVVGVAILVSLVGRAKIYQGDRLTTEGIHSNMNRADIADHETDWAKVEAEEKKRNKEKAEAEEQAKETKKSKSGQKGKPEEKNPSEEKNEPEKKNGSKEKTESDEKTESGEKNESGEKSESVERSETEENKPGDNPNESKPEENADPAE